MNYSIADLRTLIDHHCNNPHCNTVVPGLRLHSATSPNQGVNTNYRPSLCLIAQGHKQVLLNDHVFEYDPSQYLVATMELPVTGCIVHASPAQPYLGLSFDLDPALIADLLLDRGGQVPDSPAAPGLTVSQLDETLLSSVVRLMQLFDQPGDVATMAPLIRREIHYRLLQGEQSAALRGIATADSHLARIGRVAEWIRTHYDEPVSVDALAARANMSVTSFHRHFKAITLMTPLQYRTKIRLQEARRLLLARPQTVASIGFKVGYDSPSQFNREYRRMFGTPPAADAAQLRNNKPASDIAASR